MGRDDEEYQAFVVARYGSLVRAAVLLGCPRRDAEDAAQEALIRCYGAWARVSAANDPDAYAYRVLVNGISHRRRRRWNDEAPYAEVPEPSAAGDPAVGASVREAVRIALARLTVRHRQVLVLRYFADLSEARTAEILGIPPGTVKSRASRAIALLSQDSSLVELTATLREEDG